MEPNDDEIVPDGRCDFNRYSTTSPRCAKPGLYGDPHPERFTDPIFAAAFRGGRWCEEHKDYTDVLLVDGVKD
jgi:hypothetical protein